jgi:Tfp pilus assembly protein PilX
MRIEPRRQRGITLVLSMILLVLITLIAVTTFNVGRGSIEVVGNLQQSSDAASAAQEAIEQAVSTTRLVDSPQAVVSPGCGGTANTVCVDLNGDGTPDVNVALKGPGGVGNPSCIKAQVVKNAALDLSSSDDLACTISRQSFGIQGVPAGDSLCTDAIYEVVAVAADATTGSSTTVSEGVALRVPTETIVNNCP